MSRARYPAKIRNRFVELCVEALTMFNQPDEAAGPVDRRHSKKFHFESGSSHYELVASPASVDEGDRTKAAAVVGVLWDVTATRHLQNKIDAIDAALHDWIGKRLGIPTWKLLGLNPPHVRTTFTIGVAQPDEVRAKVDEALQDGASGENS